MNRRSFLKVLAYAPILGLFIPGKVFSKSSQLDVPKEFSRDTGEWFGVQTIYSDKNKDRYTYIIKVQDSKDNWHFVDESNSLKGVATFYASESLQIVKAGFFY